MQIMSKGRELLDVVSESLERFSFESVARPDRGV